MRIFLDEVGSDQSGGILSPFMGTACWIQPPQYVPLEQQMWCPGPQFVQQPTATAGAPGQQARMLSPWHQPCGG